MAPDKHTWADYYREIDEARTAIMYGDFARGRRNPKQTTVRVGTFAGGGRKLPPPTRKTPWRRDHLNVLDPSEEAAHGSPR